MEHFRPIDQVDEMVERAASIKGDGTYWHFTAPDFGIDELVEMT
jgi:hypothetical protein